MYENHFQRVEEKYLLDKKTKELFLNKIKDYIEKDAYYESNIYTIYFDSNNELIINSLEKPIFKDKFRVRSYGLPKLDDYVFLETKTKYKGVVGKRRIKLKLKDYFDFIDGKYEEDSQIFKEINYYFKYYNLIPSIFIAYDRYSFIGKNDKSLRITLDSNLRSSRTNFEFKDEELIKYFDEDYYIMEIKLLGSMPLWLVNVLSELKIYPKSFSKYGKIYEREMKERRNNNVK